MASIWDSIKETAESFGGVGIAAPGAVWDIANMPFDDKDDDFGSVVNRLSKAGAATLDPILNDKTITGDVFTRTMEAANWVLDNGVNEPLSTFFTGIQHAQDADTAGGRLGAIVDGDTWGKAYQIAQDQNAGQSLATMVLGTRADGYEIDPFDYDNPYDQWTHPEYGAVATGVSWTANVVGAWYLDPFAVGGKALGALRKRNSLHGLNLEERAKAYTLLNSEGSARRFRQAESTRFDNYSKALDGQNRLGRPLTAYEVVKATPELGRMDPAAANTLAAQLVEAGKIEDVAVRNDMRRRVMAVALGDASQVERLSREMTDLPHVADTLRNMVKGGAIDLKKLAADDAHQYNPVFMADLQRQVKNLDSDKAVTKFIDQWEVNLKSVLDLEGTARMLPGSSGSSGLHAQGKRALGRVNDKGLGRSLKNAHEKADDWAGRHWAQAQSASTVFQKGLHSIPIVAVRTVGLAASPYTKFPVKAGDALRQTHFTGVAHLDDWNGATAQLDSMLKIAGVPHVERMGLISQGFLKGGASEIDKQRYIDEVQKVAVKQLAKDFSVKYGNEIDQKFIENLTLNSFSRRSSALAVMRGVTYAATKQADDMAGETLERQFALRSKGAQKAADEADLADRASTFPLSAETGWTPRVDHFLDETGTPVALPLIESQLAQSVPLLDIDLMKRALEQDTSFLSRVSRSWSREAQELDELMTKRGALKGKAAVAFDKSIRTKREAMEWLTFAAERSMRVWKMSVLFRLGYPLRVVTDDHWRIWAQIGAGTFYGSNTGEAIRNLGYNAVGRRQLGKARVAEAKSRLSVLRDELDSDVMKAHVSRQERLAEIGKAYDKTRRRASKVRGTGGDASGLEREMAEFEGEMNMLLEALGDRGPDDVLREINEMTGVIKAGAKAFHGEKRHLGQGDVTIGDYTFRGSAAGPAGQAYKQLSSSKGTFDYQMKGVEGVHYGNGHQGVHRTIAPEEAGHLGAWADTINNQFGNSEVAKFFIKDGTVEDFAKWVKAPEQAHLRKRLPHLAHDPEDWGHRVNALVHDYMPTREIRDAFLKGRVTPKMLDKLTGPGGYRPAVHGKAAADTIGTSIPQLGIGRTVNSMFDFLSSKPTDQLSRHPYFNVMYKQHLEEMVALRTAGEVGPMTARDLATLENRARKLALGDLKRTLFDISAHSHAAHVMRFVSPFFAAHQEVIQRWWRIVADNPGVIRRYAMMFDAPRMAGLTVDEEGRVVKPGEPVSPEHKIMLPVPKALADTIGDREWSIHENSLNLLAPSGLFNPGAGPVVTVPVEYFATKYGEYESIEAVARVFNPYPPAQGAGLMEPAMPATVKRLSAAVYGQTGVKIPGLGDVGVREYNDSFTTNIQDLMVKFQLEHGREPTKAESDALMKRAGTETNTELWLKFANNAVSPFPARPGSKYAAIQQGWYSIREQGNQRYPDDWEAAFEWSWQNFKEKYGEAFIPLIYSESNNPARLEGSPAEVKSYRKYKGILGQVDPALSRMILGPEAYDEEMAVGSTERTTAARNFFAATRMSPGTDERYISKDDPEAAMEEQMARRGWQKYGQLTAALTAQAQQMGLESYADSDELVAVKRAAVKALREENWAFDRAMDQIDGGKYDALVDDMRQITSNRSLMSDPARTDVHTLAAYLEVRDYFVDLIERRQAAGLGGPDAAATEPVKELFTKIVMRLVESNTYFEENMFNGVLERDPLLVGSE